MNLIELKHTQNLNQHLQFIDLQYSLGYVRGNNVIQVMPWIYCKDYLGDILWSHCTGNPLTGACTYGLTYDPSAYNQISVFDFKLLIKSNYQFHISRIPSSIRSLDYLFKNDFGMNIFNFEDWRVVAVNKLVLACPPLLSFVLTFIRAGLYKIDYQSFKELQLILEPIKNHDSNLVKNVNFDFITNIVANKSKIINNYRDIYRAYSLYNIHNDHGMQKHSLAILNKEYVSNQNKYLFDLIGQPYPK